MAQINLMNQPIVKSNSLKSVLNTNSIDQPVEKRVKIDISTPSIPNISSPQVLITPHPKPVLDNKGFVDYSKEIHFNRLSAAAAEQQMRRKCWNCSNVLPSNSDGSLQSKYCTYCSAIVE